MTTKIDAQRLVLRGTRSAALGFAIRFGARLLFLFVAARLFGAALFGAYSIAVAIVEVAVTIGGLGTKRVLFKLLDEDNGAREPVHIVLDTAIAVTFASLALAVAIMGTALLLSGTSVAGATGIAVLFLAPMIAGQALLDLFGAATRWKHRMRYDVVSRSICEPYAAIVAALAAWLLGFHTTGLLISYWAGTLAALAYALWGVRNCYGSLQLARFRFSPRAVYAILKGNSLATLSDFLNGAFGRLDLYFVGIMLGEAAAGIYGMARQIRTPIRQVRQSFDGLLTPLVARTLAARGVDTALRATTSATRLLVAIQLPMLIALLAIGRPLLDAFGPSFAAGYAALLALALAETIQAAFGVSQLILLYRRPALALRVVAIGIAVNAAAAWALIGTWGIDGAALAVLLAVIAGAALRRLLLRAGLGLSAPFAHSGGPIAAGLIGAGIGWLASAAFSASWASAAAGLVAGLGAYALLLFLWLRWSGERLALDHLEPTSAPLSSSCG